MLEKYGSFWEIQCDYCPESFNTEEDDFRDAVQVAKKEGWRVFKTGSDWEHKCPCCCDNEVNFDDD